MWLWRYLISRLLLDYARGVLRRRKGRDQC